jgi:esterase
MSVDLHFECVGAGRAVVVLHGLFGAGRNWLTVARRMAPDYAFYLVDLRNHGRSPHNATMTYLDMAADVRALIEKLELDDVVLVGHSMGGKVAMTLALNDPRAIARLINIDIAPVSYPDRFVEMIIAMRALDLSTIRRRGDADALLADAIPELPVRQFILQNLMFDSGAARWRANLAALQDQMTDILGPLPIAEDAHFGGDTWFIRGELSDRITAVQMPLIERLFGNHRIETVAGGGHWPHAEAPAAFMAIFERALHP